MVNAVSSGSHHLDDTTQARGVSRSLVIEDLDGAGQCDVALFSICIISVPANDATGQFAA
ncbi:hypothetical protein ACIBL6_21855 [Streptomyces sp. NPDC050400]|uniref:hypothetical protein n=1 Tax=Streptomyces sp. NPDC050400 TaxID=3365610 RepID=UPI0037BB1383